MTITQVINAISGYYEKETDLIKALRVLIWTPMRWSTWRIVNLWTKKPISRPEALVRFEWDKVEVPTEDKIEELKHQFPDRFGSTQ